MSNLKNKDGRPYSATCCNVVAELINTRVTGERVEQRGTNGDRHEVKIVSRTHTVRCPNYHCQREYEVHDTIETA